jgi:ATP-dependent helicase HrpB
VTLPVVACLDELRAALAGRGLAVLQAPPGAGKTTVVPPALLDEPWLAHGPAGPDSAGASAARRSTAGEAPAGGLRIVMLEPRRLATRAAARRMAALRRERVGETIGYRTRDDRQVGPATRVEVVTEGILTRRLQRDPGLEGVGLVIFDEFHERSLQADLGLALALDARRHLRPELRLLVMSATLDGERVAALLGGGGPPAPVITSESRSHPVEVRWAPRRPREHIEPATVAAVRQVPPRSSAPASSSPPPCPPVHPSTSTCCTGRCPPSTRTPRSSPACRGGARWSSPPTSRRPA